MTSEAGYFWKINDDADTTVKSTDCAYDRIVVKGPDVVEGTSEASVFNYVDEYKTEEKFYCKTADNCEPISELVSDHYPVEMFIL